MNEMMAANGSGLSREVAEFLESMPAAYAHAFTLREAEEHAHIVARRGTQLAHAEGCAGSSDPAFVCVVADDQPGLLSFVAHALLVHGLNITRAQVYCRRRRDGKQEAVDFFWLAPSVTSEPADAGVDASEFTSFAQTLRELIAEEQLVGQQPGERDTIPVPGQRPSRVYFDIEALRRSEFVLMVETLDFPGLLFTISSALHGSGMRILDSEIRTEDGFALDRFSLASASAEALTAARLCDIQQAVQAAVVAERSRS